MRFSKKNSNRLPMKGKVKTGFLIPKKLTFHSTNTYYEIMKPSIEKKQKEEKNR